MLASQYPVGSRLLQVSTIRTLSHAPALSTLVIGSSNRGRLPRQVASLPTISRRNFWGGRNRSHHWATLLGAHNYHGHYKTRYDVTKEKGPRPPYQNYVSNWHHPLNQYRPSQGWRLSSSWGKQGGRWSKSESTSEGKNTIKELDTEWKQEYAKQQAAIAQRLEMFKKQIERDPFGMLFGKAVERSINPWTSLNWLLAFKEGKDVATSGGTPTNSLPSDGGDARPPACAPRSNESLRQASTGERQVEGTPTTQTTSDQHVREAIEPKPYVDTANKPIVIEDYEIDPITLRKVHKIHKETPPPDTKATFDAAVDIPVKTFKDGVARSFLLDTRNDTAFTVKKTPIKPSNEIKTSTHSDPDNKSSTAPTPGKTWLAQEGFGERPAMVATKLATQIPDSAKNETSSAANADPRRLENSLDRHRRNAVSKNKAENCIKTSNKSLEYKPEESKAEDMDLLRASDVRASYGHVARSGKETDAEKQSRRHIIEVNYQERRQNLENQYTEELAAEEALTVIGNAKRPEAELGQGSTTQDLEGSFLNEISIQEPSTASVDPARSLLVAQSPDTSYQREVDARVQKEENLYARDLEVASTQIQPDKDVDVASTRVQPAKNVFMDNMKAQLVGAGIKYTKDLKRGVDYAHEALLRIDNNLSSSPARDRKQEAAEQALAEEVKVQKSAMAAIEDRKLLDSSKPSSAVQGLQQGEGDMSDNVHEFGERDRWYKNKAPHAVKDQAKKLRDRDLIREIRNIYEDSYGTIDTKHRQVRESKVGKKAKRAAVQVRKQSSNERRKGTNKLNVVPHPQEAAATASPNDAIAKPVSKAQEAMKASSKPSSSTAAKSSRGLPTFQRDSRTNGRAPQHNQDQMLQASRNRNRMAERQAQVQMEKLQDLIRAGMEWQRDEAALVKLPKVERVSDDATVPGEEHKGTVPTSPTPSTSTAAPAPASPKPPTLYKILAHDPSTGKINIASTTSFTASPSSPPTSISEALMRLTSPARFLPHFAPLRHAGYEIVSGSGDVLVFKKVRDAECNPVEEDAAVDETITAAEAADRDAISSNAFASPTPFTATATNDAVFPPLHADSTPASAPVRRQEAVFSGSPRWRYDREQESDHSDQENGAGRKKGFGQKARRVVNRVLWVGVWTAGCCYAVGVVAEVVMPRGEGVRRDGGGGGVKEVEG